MPSYIVCPSVCLCSVTMMSRGHISLATLNVYTLAIRLAKSFSTQNFGDFVQVKRAQI